MSGLAAAHDRLRPLMFSIAYRMLGSVAEAEDVVQEAMIRLLASERAGTVLASDEAFATTVTTRLAIDELRSARRRRERYVGPWLPEPLVTPDDPAARVEVDESVTAAFLVLAEHLTPQERAAFLLRVVLGYEYERVADVLGRSQASTRQLVSRARRRLAAARTGSEPDQDATADALVRVFLSAVRDGDTPALERLLAEDVELVADGGGRAPALTSPLVGNGRVARFVAGLVRQGARLGLGLDVVRANDRPALLVASRVGEILAVLGADTAGGRIVRISNQMNPDKLAHLGPVGDMYVLLRGGEGSAPGSEAE